MPNSADQALFIWCAVVLVLILVWPSGRKSLGSIIKALVHWKLLLSILMLTAWATGEVILGRWTAIWNTALTTSTAIWFFTVGFVLFVNATSVATEEHYVRKRLVGFIALPVFVNVFLNLLPPNLAVELVLQPLMVLLVAALVVSQRKDDYRSAQNPIAAIIVLLVILLVVSEATSLYGQRASLNWRQVGLQFLLPVWLSLLVFPLIYAIGLFATYGQALASLRIYGRPSRREQWSRGMALVLRFGLSAKKLREFMNDSRGRVLQAKTIRETWQLVRRYRQAHLPSKDGEAAIADDET